MYYLCTTEYYLFGSIQCLAATTVGYSSTQPLLHVAMPRCHHRQLQLDSASITRGHASLPPPAATARLSLYYTWQYLAATTGSNSSTQPLLHVAMPRCHHWQLQLDSPSTYSTGVFKLHIRNLVHPNEKVIYKV